MPAVPSAVGVRVVGVVLLFSALAKAIAPGGFAAHIGRMATLPARLAAMIAVVTIVGETALAMPLIVEAGPRAAEIATLVLLAAFSIATICAWRLGRIEECGCHGPFLRLSPPVSGGVNLAMILLLAVGLAGRDSASTVRYAVLAWAIGAGVLLAATLLALPRLMGLIAVGRPWPAGWLPQVKMAPGNDDRIVAFLTPACRRCRVWAKALKSLAATPDFPGISVISAGEWKNGAGLLAPSPLPVAVCGAVRLWLLNVEVPMTVLARNGLVVEVWRQTLPAAWVDHLKGKRTNHARIDYESLPLKT